MIRERDIVKVLYNKVLRLGGEVRKLKWIGRSNAPDLLVLLKGCVFVECKAPGKKPRVGQLREHTRMRALGLRVEVVSTFDEVSTLVESLAD